MIREFAARLRSLGRPTEPAYDEFYRQRADADKLVILVHGLTGHVSDTWGKMPALIRDTTDYDVLLIGYPSRRLLSAPDVDHVGEYLLTQMRERCQGYSRIVLVGHSLGGLVIQSAVVQTLRRGRDVEPSISAIAHIVLYAPPLEGNDLPTIAGALGVPMSRQARRLASGNDWLIALRRDWVNRMYRDEGAEHDPHRQHIPVTIVTGLQDRYVPRERAVSVFDTPPPRAVPGSHTTLKLPNGPDDIRFLVLRNVLWAAEVEQANEPPGEVMEDQAGSGQDADRNPHPLAQTPDGATALLKDYLDGHRPTQAHALMLDAARCLRDAISDEHFPINGVRVTPESIRERVAAYETLSATVLSLIATGCHWGRPEYDESWRQCVETIAEEPARFGGSLLWMHLSSYPALLILYAGGLAATASGNYTTLARLLIGGSTWRDHVEFPLVVALSGGRVFYREAADHLSSDATTTLRAPMSEHLHDVLRDPLKDYIPQDAQYDKHVDRFEFLLALVYGDETSKRGIGSWPPLGRFAWRVKYAPSHGFYDVVTTIETEVQAAGNQWPPLKAGLFDGSVDRFMAVFTAYKAYLTSEISTWM